MNARADIVEANKAKAPRPPRNGVDTPNLLGTINVVAGQPELGKFQFRARNTWQTGTHSRTMMNGFHGAGQEHERAQTFIAEGDHPSVLVGGDKAPTPVEFLLHALAACLTAGIGNIAAVRGVTLTKVSSVVEGDIDLRGILGLSDEVRNGFENICIRFEIDGDASPEVLREIVAQSRARSAVFDVLTNGVPVEVEVARAG